MGHHAVVGAVGVQRVAGYFAAAGGVVRAQPREAPVDHATFNTGGEPDRGPTEAIARPAKAATRGCAVGSRERRTHFVSAMAAATGRASATR